MTHTYGLDPKSAPAFCVVGENLVCTAYAGPMTPCEESATRRFQSDMSGAAYCDDHWNPERQDKRELNRFRLSVWGTAARPGNKQGFVGGWLLTEILDNQEAK